MKRAVIALLIVLSGTSYGEIYRWKDSRGTVHYTNLPDTIPPKYRNSARVLPNMPGEQKKDQVASPQGQGQQVPPQTALPLPPPPAATPKGSGIDQRSRSERSRRVTQDDD